MAKELTEEQMERQREACRRYYAKNAEKRRAYAIEYYREHTESRRAYQRERPKEVKKKIRDKSFAKRKTQVYEHYGNKCACCDETEPKFLSIDHVNGDGAKHRKTLPGGGSSLRSLFVDIVRRGFPTEFQILCMNCNCGRHRNGGICPHKKVSG